MLTKNCEICIVTCFAASLVDTGKCKHALLVLDMWICVKWYTWFFNQWDCLHAIKPLPLPICLDAFVNWTCICKEFDGWWCTAVVNKKLTFCICSTCVQLQNDTMNCVRMLVGHNTLTAKLEISMKFSVTFAVVSHNDNCLRTRGCVWKVRNGVLASVLDQPHV